MKPILILLFVFFEHTITNAQICLHSSNGQITIKIIGVFEQSRKDIYVIYKGQQKKIKLKYIKSNYEYTKGAAHGTDYTYYNEVVNGKITGKYEVDQSANVVYVIYTRTRDKKKFEFSESADGYDCNW